MAGILSLPGSATDILMELNVDSFGKSSIRSLPLSNNYFHYYYIDQTFLQNNRAETMQLIG
jgi:hypothetical protein